MINSAELRIGNNLNDRVGLEKHLVVYKIEKGIITCGDEDFNYPYLANQLIPIPLTPEILEKCGFNRQDNGWHKLNICEDYINLYFERLAKTELSISGLGVKMPHIQYLHQLQNLIHSLTGEELTIKL